MRGLRPLPERVRRCLRPANTAPQKRVFRLFQLHRGLSGGRTFVQVHAAPQARSHRARRARTTRVSRHIDWPRILRLWPHLRCEGASDPQTQRRESERFLCFNCIEDCPEDALSFKFMPPLKREVTAPVVPGRRAFLGTLIGLGFYAFGRTSGASDRNYDKKVIRPPGSVEEKDFLDRCIKCDQCIRTCPTNVLQPALMESGIGGIWTPILNMKIGFCEVNCTLCGQVCPTGAIQRITIEEKTGTGLFVEEGPIKLGTAFFDQGRCLPWAMETPCVVCEEVCPVSPKAIFSREVTITKRDGNPITLRRPYMDPALCIGCGICE